MSVYELDFRDHIRYSEIWDILEIFRDIASDGDYELSLSGFEKYVSEQFYQDLKPFWEFTLDEVVDADYKDYPSQKWLASIYNVGRKTCLKESMKHGDILLAQLRAAWFFGSDEDIFHFNEETKVLTAYTSGWSGCEDIVSALGYAFPWIDSLHSELIFDMRYFFKEDGKE
jgi:hypothetical protein